MSINKIKGDEYEVFIKNYIINNLNKEAYLWDDIPEKILIDSKLMNSHNDKRLKRKENKVNPLIDVGFDLLQIDENNYTGVQCKNGYNDGLRIDNLSGFYMLAANYTHFNNYIVYHTSKISHNIKNHMFNDKIKYIKLLMNETETKEEIKTEFKPHDYQIEASNKIINHLGDNNKAILSMPCGCGKTYTSYLIANKYDKVVMISPLKQFAKQNLDRYVEYGRNNTLLLDSDGTRDIDQITEFINNNAKFLISATYKSVDILQQLNLQNFLIIIDEFHNLSKNNVCNEEDNFYKLLISNNKFLLMSATPRIYELEDDDDENNNIDLGETVYKMTFTEAIQKKYICDYKIWLPSIQEDNSDLNNELINEIGIDDIDNELKAKCMFLFKNLLDHGSKKCILYCQDTNNLNDIKDCIVKLNDFYSIDLNIQEITSETSYKNREKILTDFESSNKIELLLSIRICDECIDIPACDSIYITYPSSCKIRTIQRLCRCIRTDENNKFKIGNIFLWCNEYDKILNTISGIKEYDVFFKDKIRVLRTNFMNKKEIDEKFIEDEKLIEKYILDIKEFRQYTWNEKLEMVKQYINENRVRPNSNDNNIEIKQLAQWICHQQQNYKNKKDIMKKEKIYNKWTDFINEYQEYFLSKEEIWYDNLNKVRNYIDNNKKKPSQIDKDKEIKPQASWINKQQRNYKNKEYIMKNEEIYNKWTNFMNEYEEYLKSYEDIWYNNFNNLKKYIDDNKKKPSISNKNKEIKFLAKWIDTQQQNYKKKKDIIKEDKIYTEWTQFMNKYKEYFLSNEEIWYNNLNKVKEYIDENKKKPSQSDKNKEIKQLAQWITDQKQNYKNKKEIMKNEEIYNKWTNFMNEYQEYVKSYEEIWYNSFNKIKEYIDNNKKRPSSTDKDKEIKHLGSWIIIQKQNYKKKEQIMKNEEIYNEWKNFMNEYEEYFLSNEEIWYDTFNKVKKYLDDNKKRPSTHDKGIEIKQLGRWICSQQKKYKKKEEIMKNEEIYDKWTIFINEYEKYFN